MVEQIIQSSIGEIPLYKATMSDELSDKFQSIFPSWPTMLATILALLLLLAIFSGPIYRGVKKMHNDRKSYIQNNIDSAEEQNDEAAKDRELANKELIQAHLSAAEIINKAKQEAEVVRVNKINQAKLEAEIVLKDAKMQVLAQQAKFDEEKEVAIVEVALEAASKIIEKEVDNKTNRRIIEDFIKAKK